MNKQATDNTAVDYQRLTWFILEKSINRAISSVVRLNVVHIAVSLLKGNMIRGKGLFALYIIQAQAASPDSTSVYAALVAMINSMFPENGKLVLTRLIIVVLQGLKGVSKTANRNAVSFIAHLVIQEVAHENVATEIINFLLEKKTCVDSLEAALHLLNQCGHKLFEKSPHNVNAIINNLREVLNSPSLDGQIKDLIDIALKSHQNAYADFPSIPRELKLVEKQITHNFSLKSDLNAENHLDSFVHDPNFEENEKRYKDLKTEILFINAEKFLQFYDSFLPELDDESEDEDAGVKRQRRDD